MKAVKQFFEASQDKKCQEDLQRVSIPQSLEKKSFFLYNLPHAMQPTSPRIHFA